MSSPRSLEGIGNYYRNNIEAVVPPPLEHSIHPYPITEATSDLETSRTPGQLLRSASEDADPRRQASCRASLVARIC